MNFACTASKQPVSTRWRKNPRCLVRFWANKIMCFGAQLFSILASWKRKNKTTILTLILFNNHTKMMRQHAFTPAQFSCLHSQPDPSTKTEEACTHLESSWWAKIHRNRTTKSLYHFKTKSQSKKQIKLKKQRNLIKKYKFTTSFYLQILKKSRQRTIEHRRKATSCQRSPPTWTISKSNFRS